MESPYGQAIRFTPFCLENLPTFVWHNFFYPQILQSNEKHHSLRISCAIALLVLPFRKPSLYPFPLLAYSFIFRCPLKKVCGCNSCTPSVNGRVSKTHFEANGHYSLPFFKSIELLVSMNVESVSKAKSICRDKVYMETPVASPFSSHLLPKIA